MVDHGFSALDWRLAVHRGGEAAHLRGIVVDILRFCHRSEVTDMGVGGRPGGPLGGDVEGLRGRERVVGGLREGVRRHATTVHSNSSFPLTIVGGNSFRSMSTSSRSLKNNPHFEV